MHIIRLCANTGCYLHLIEPLGFKLEDKQLRRAGLDYHEWADVKTYQSIDELTPDIDAGNRVYAISTKGKNITSRQSLMREIFLFSVLKPEACRIHIWTH